MYIIEEIVNFYNKRIDDNKRKIVDAVVSVIGEESRELISKKIDGLMPIYVITREGLELTRETLELQSEEEKLVSYFEDLIGDLESLYIGHYGKLSPLKTEIVKNSDDTFIMNLCEFTNDVSFHYKTNIYNGAYSKDLNFISHLLIYAGVRKETNRVVFSLGSGKDSDLISAYSSIINELSTMVLLRLRKDGVYVLDNKSLVYSVRDSMKFLSNSFIIFYNHFKELIPLFLTDYSKFLDIIGKEEFLELVDVISVDDVDSVQDIIYRMLCNKCSLGNIDINLGLIESSVRRYKNKNSK